MKKFLMSQSPVRIIAFGFAFMIILGSVLLILPCSIKEGVDITYLDALYTSASAVCVTGLLTVDAGDTFTTFGHMVLAVLMQFGGLGLSSIGAGIILLIGKKVNIKGRTLIKESMNLNSGRGIVIFLKSIFKTTLTIELIGAGLSFIVFIKNYSPIKALGLSIFHSIAAFNNAGIDILGNMQSLTAYKGDIMMNAVTSVLIILGGIGFWVIRDVLDEKFRWKKLSMHSKVVISFSAFLIVFGAVLIKFTEDISWMGAMFLSISARTAGFSTYPLAGFSKSALLVVSVLMFIGASPGSTGGGIKTSTVFVLLQGIKSAATNKSERAFNYSIPPDAFRKSAVIAILAFVIITFSTFIISVFEPSMAMEDLFIEIVSAFATVGLSTGITPCLCTASKIICIMLMYIGRLGPLTVATLWNFTDSERARYPYGNISVG